MTLLIGLIVFIVVLLLNLSLAKVASDADDRAKTMQRKNNTYKN